MKAKQRKPLMFFSVFGHTKEKVSTCSNNSNLVNSFSFFYLFSFSFSYLFFQLKKKLNKTKSLKTKVSTVSFLFTKFNLMVYITQGWDSFARVPGIFPIQIQRTPAPPKKNPKIFAKRNPPCSLHFKYSLILAYVLHVQKNLNLRMRICGFISFLEPKNLPEL